MPGGWLLPLHLQGLDLFPEGRDLGLQLCGLRAEREDEVLGFRRQAIPGDVGGYRGLCPHAGGLSA
jgi:hypothetical protein